MNDEPEFPWTLEDLERAKSLLESHDGAVLEAVRILLRPLVDMLIEAKKRNPQ